MSPEQIHENAREELAKISQLLQNLEESWKEVQQKIDKPRAERIIAWLPQQIEAARTLGASAQQIAPLELYLIKFQTFAKADADILRAESPERLEWNNDIILTFDDSLVNSFTILQYLESQKVTNYRFYGIASTAIKQDILKDMGVQDGKTSSKIAPGKWLSEYVDKKRGTLSRKDYIRRHMLKGTADARAGATDFLEIGEKIKTFYQQKYPENWEQKIQETFQYHASFLHPKSTDTRHHIQYWQEDQIQEDIQFYEEFIKAWFDIDEYQVLHLRSPEGGGFGFDRYTSNRTSKTERAEKLIKVAHGVHPEAQWDMWRTNSFDTHTHGRFDQSGRTLSDIAQDATNYRTQKMGYYYESQQNLLLLHSHYYGTSQSLAKLGVLIEELSKKNNPDTTPENQNIKIEKGATIIIDNAWARDNPSTQGSQVIHKFPQNTRVFVEYKIKENPQWLKITWGRDEKTGYIHESQLRIDNTPSVEKIPSLDNIQSQLNSIPEKLRYRFSEAEKSRVIQEIEKQKTHFDLSQSQYMVFVDRAENKQFICLVYYDKEKDSFQMVDDFGSLTSTGKQNVSEREWATPLGVYDRKPLEAQRKREGKKEWRTKGGGGGGYGPPGSRVFALGEVNVQSPYGENLKVALHKTSRNSQRFLGKSAQSHGCIRTSDEFIDLLDSNGLMDGEYGRYVIVGDSSQQEYPGDYQQL